MLHPTDEVMFDVIRAMRAGMTIGRINQLSSIDPWFLIKIKNIVTMEDLLRRSNIDEGLIKEAKKKGFSDNQIGKCWGMPETKVTLFKN